MDAALIRRLRTGWPAAFACLLALLPAQVSGAAEWGVCAPSTLPAPPPEGREASTLQADSAGLREDGVSVAKGNVVLSTPDRTITSDQMDYDAAAGTAEATGEVTVREREVFLEGRRLHANLETGEIVMDDARFRHPDSHGRGDAKRVEHNRRSTVITDGSFTTCDPGSRAWRLEADSLELDHEAGVGTARHARLSFFDFPLLYTPWISFPIGGDRKTGFLIPTFGSSGNAGTSVTLPYYLNLAPNYDATLRPRLTSRRGGVLGGQFRFLTEGGTGTLEAEVLPDDRITRDSRSLLSLRHRQRFAPHVDSRVQYARVSDIDYLRDLETGTAVANTDYLHRFAAVAYDGPAVRFAAEVEDYQILEDTPDRLDPYRVAPRLALESRLPERSQRLHFGFHGEVARFDHRSNMAASGTRLDLHPSVAIPLRSSFGYLLPRASLHYTGYDLEDAPEGVASTPTRVVPSFSVGGGLYFDNESAVEGRRFTQTFEPRFHYLRVPYRDQDRLPLFDAGSLTSGYDHMFRENRFNGSDRIGDADRLTLAIDSRLLDGGREVLETRIGTMRHFRDRQVRLCTTADPEPGSTHCPARDESNGDERGPSTWIAAVKARPHRSFTIGGTVEDGGGGSRYRAVSLDLRYHPSPERVMNVGYRRFPVETSSDGRVQERVDDVTESVSISAHHDLGPNVRVLGSASYALAEDTMTEVYTGIEFDSCCWRARVVGQRYLPGGSTDHENSVMLQLELKGLAGVGRGTDRTRVRPIPGYRNPF